MSFSVCKFAVQGLGGILDQRLPLRWCDNPMWDFQVCVPVERPPLRLLMGTILHGCHDNTSKVVSHTQFNLHFLDPVVLKTQLRTTAEEHCPPHALFTNYIVYTATF